jgi:hypothetical protein
MMPALKDSLATDGLEDYDDFQLAQAVENWANVEDAPHVIEAEIDEALEAYDNENVMVASSLEIAIDDSESEASSDSSKDYDIITTAQVTKNISQLRKYVLQENAPRDISALLHSLERKLAEHRSKVRTSQPSLLNLWGPK